jgi:hypothetical protein
MDIQPRTSLNLPHLNTSKSELNKINPYINSSIESSLPSCNYNIYANSIPQPQAAPPISTYPMLNHPSISEISLLSEIDNEESNIFASNRLNQFNTKQRGAAASAMLSHSDEFEFLKPRDPTKIPISVSQSYNHVDLNKVILFLRKFFMFYFSESEFGETETTSNVSKSIHMTFLYSLNSISQIFFILIYVSINLIK